eukprot:14925863-Ditylum_brightwellii.AAC.1
MQASWRGGPTAIILLLCNPSLPGRGCLRWGSGPPYYGRGRQGDLIHPQPLRNNLPVFGA